MGGYRSILKLKRARGMLGGAYSCGQFCPDSAVPSARNGAVFDDIFSRHSHLDEHLIEVLTFVLLVKRLGASVL